MGVEMWTLKMIAWRPLHYAKVAMGSRRFDLGWPGSGIGPGTDMPKKSHQQELLPLQTFWINI